MTSPSRRRPGETPTSAGLAYEEVGLLSTDGIRLKAWWVPIEGSSRAAVLVHGWGGHRSDEHVLKTAPVYLREGYSVLIIDLRAQGESGGRRRTLGYREVRDVRGALLWLKGRGYGPGETVLHGWSMGGATVVRAAPGTGVAAVVEEAGYADLPLLLERAIPRIAGLPRLFVPGVLLAGKLWPDFDAWDVQPDREASELLREGVPLFIIHSSEDGLIPVEHAEKFAAAHPEAAVWILPDHDHVEAFAHPEYEERLRSFLRTVTTKRRPAPPT
ncbi:alpha/beta fold hydrolase [Rubrobacter tropicus]|uniref:Alpha/beta fold hydrolase n=2 Tax=Rubrobacter tropicus TaxID=2653851 RepID=A0A6G8QFC2_9ACTN|nr:alpha/beta fold hydrolase [Rubrobacter tropicus]